MPVTLRGRVKLIHTYALLDEGSTVTMIDSKIAHLIGIEGLKSTINLKGIRDKIAVRVEAERIELDLESCTGKYHLNNVLAVENLPLPSQSLSVEITEICAKRIGVEIIPYENATPTILLGQDNWSLITTREFFKFSGHPFAVSYTELGWCIHGPSRGASSEEPQLISDTFVCQESINENVQLRDELLSLENLVKKYFQIDSLSTDDKKLSNSADTHALKILNEKSRRIGNLWETALLWKQGCTSVPNSKPNAMKRLFAIERILDKDSVYAALYYKEMERLIELGYAVELPESTPGVRQWYLPHFGVKNINKPGKLRLVFDAAAKTFGVSLNDQLLTGPDFLRSLLGVLMRFRQRPFALIADIKDMFLKIKMNKEDCQSQRFLWRGRDRSSKPREFVMNTVLFGAKSSPATALYIKDRNASEFALSKSEAVRNIHKNCYMDDFLASTNTENEAIELVRDVIEINGAADFVMHGWASNSQKVVKEALGQTEIPHAKDLDKDEKVLGLFWNTYTDELSFKIDQRRIQREILTCQKRPTKREFLRIIMSIFDPLGILAPYSIQSRILMQEIWISGIKWDEQLRDDEFKSWKLWLENLTKISKCKIPRFYNYNCLVEKEISLHVFCDASKKAYAAVAYWRFSAPDETSVNVSFIAARSRVAPVKLISIPRLELQAALLACRLAKTIEQEHEFKITRRVFWSDSSTVLQWLRSDPRSQPIFVAMIL